MIFSLLVNSGNFFGSFGNFSLPEKFTFVTMLLGFLFVNLAMSSNKSECVSRCVFGTLAAHEIC